MQMAASVVANGFVGHRRKEKSKPRPFKTERVGHPERLNQSLGDDVLEWYHPIVNARQQKKCERVGHPPTFDIRTIHSGGLLRTLQFNIAFLLTSGSQCTARSAPCQYGARR